ncbi:MAG: 30S ribosomal protein S5 [Armatimonadota bacterium]|nr:30S ribosomal protein S5 [Armatimonadota bacterium]
MPRINADTLDLEERVVRTNKCQKTHKGGRTLSWNVLVAVGDRKGHVGVGLGKARAIPDAIRKGVEEAKKHIILIPLIGSTIPHEIEGSAGASIVMLKPASPGTGVVAGGSVRPILELAGVRDVLAKSLGSANAINTAAATMVGLKMLKRAEETAALRGKSVAEMVPWMARLLAEEKAFAGAKEETEVQASAEEETTEVPAA